jgi:hypothetical protein
MRVAERPVPATFTFGGLAKRGRVVAEQHTAVEPALVPRYPAWCSFCRKSHTDVGPLAEGPDAV